MRYKSTNIIKYQDCKYLYIEITCLVKMEQEHVRFLSIRDICKRFLSIRDFCKRAIHTQSRLEIDN